MVKRLLISLMLAAVLLLPVTDARAARAPHTELPTRECQHDPTAVGAAGPGDLEIAPDGTWFECVCELHVFTAPDCTWYEITSPAADPQRLKRLTPLARRQRRLARRVVIIGVRL